LKQAPIPHAAKHQIILPNTHCIIYFRRMKYTLATSGDRSSTWRTYSGEGVSKSTTHPFKKDRNGIDHGGISLLATPKSRGRLKPFSPLPTLVLIVSTNIVFVADANRPRSCWPLALIVGVQRNDKDDVRRVTVKTKTSTLQRPIDK